MLYYLKKYFLLAAVIWTVIVAASLIWNINVTKRSSYEEAVLHARSLYEKDILYRQWNALHGGVYAPVTEQTPPNPYLSHIPDRDIVTTSGRKLTLINPAYMLRQVLELQSKQYPIKEHLTSLKPVNPLNKPDEWEKAALEDMEKSFKKEITSVRIENGEPYIRLIRPLVTDESCMRCHAKQGYKVGSIRGGISISVPMTPFLNAHKSDIRMLYTTHLFFWLTGIAGILTGYTKHRSFEKQREETTRRLKESEAFVSSVLEGIGEGVIVVDRDFKILSTNRNYCAQVKMSCEDIIGKHCYEISHHIEKPCHTHENGCECTVKKCFDTGEPQNATHTHYDSQGNARYIETHAYPLKDGSGNIVSVVETLFDVTEKTRLVLEKKKLEAQVLQAQKMEAIGQLAGGIAHDFNNILTAVMGYGSILQEEMEKDDPMRNNVEHILTAAGKAATLTQSLLAFGRKQIIELRPVNATEIISGFSKFVKRLVPDDIEFKTALSDENLPVMADIGQVDQVLMNLVTNAIDAMPEGGRLIISAESTHVDRKNYKLHNLERPGKYALIAVSDTGMGMDENTRQRIFEPFFSTKETGKGTGLGLAMVYGIIKQHNGSIRVYSEPGSGTTFKIYLPAIADATEQTKSRHQIPKEKISGTETVLLAEDDADVRRIAKLALTKAGYKVIEAVDGQDAVNKFIENKNDIQLLIFDVIMPNMNGRDAYDRIKTEYPDIKVIFMSGYMADIIDRKGIFDAGLNFLSKPAEPHELLKKVRKTLDKQARH
jgi:PAS domain S-box-containing protein